MEAKMITLELPANVFSDLQALATEAHSEPADMVGRLVGTARKRRAWLNDLETLRLEIEKHGTLLAGLTQEETLERLHQTRREIFEAEYAHLYR